MAADNSILQKIGRLTAQVLIAFLVVECILRIVFFQRNGREPLAIIEQLKNVKRKIVNKETAQLFNQYKVARPDSTNEVNKEIAAEVIASNRFEYSPWVEYKNIDFAGKYINTSGLMRKTTPEKFENKKDALPLTVYFIGGSTMYGFNATDRETIPSFFVSEYQKQFPTGHSIHVSNFGICAYYSYNELMLFSHLIFTGKKPDIIIVLDGLNDFYMLGAAVNRWPYFYYRLKVGSNDNFTFKQAAAIADSTNQLFELPLNQRSTSLLSDTLLALYNRNISSIRQLAATNGVNAFFFVQPTSFYNYPNKANDNICHPGRSEIIEMVYPILEKNADSSRQNYFLGNLLKQELGHPFIDKIHYAPFMNQKIAAIIAGIVGKRINKPHQ
jgi:hypothetical protein